MSRRCVVLIGMMGAGKSEVGELLADQLGYEFVDVDKNIERVAGKRIHAIFAEKGEEAFRELEREAVSQLAASQNLVIAVGGGAPVDPENRRVLSKLGHVVYLAASARELYQRIKNDRGRPLLEVDDPRAEVARLLGERRDIYELCCDFQIETEELGVDEVVDQIIDELAKRTVETEYLDD